MKKKITTGVCTGMSMSPLINNGDRLFIEKVNVNKLNRGDIIVFLLGNKQVSHRVIKKIDQYILCKGDNVPYYDPKVKKDMIIGKVIQISGKYGTIMTDKPLFKIVNTYLLVYSLATYHLPKTLKKVLVTLFRGRRFLIKKIAE